MTEEDKENLSPSQSEDKPQGEPEVKPFLPEQLKRPNFQPPKFKYVPPKAGKRHF